MFLGRAMGFGPGVGQYWLPNISRTENTLSTESGLCHSREIELDQSVQLVSRV